MTSIYHLSQQYAISKNSQEPSITLAPFRSPLPVTSVRLSSIQVLLVLYQLGNVCISVINYGL